MGDMVLKTGPETFGGTLQNTCDQSRTATCTRATKPAWAIESEQRRKDGSREFILFHSEDGAAGTN